MAAHETFDRNHEAQGSSDRSFGLVFTSVFLVVALSPLRHHAPMRAWALGAAGLTLVVALVVPRALAPFNKIWTKFSNLLQKITNPVVMGVLFYGLMTPAGVLLRLLGKTNLAGGFDSRAESYWLTRQPPESPTDPLTSMKRQF